MEPSPRTHAIKTHRRAAAFLCCAASLVCLSTRPAFTQSSPQNTLPPIGPLNALDRELSADGRDWMTWLSSKATSSASECSFSPSGSMSCACLTWETPHGSRVQIRNIEGHASGAYHANGVWLMTPGSGTYFIAHTSKAPASSTHTTSVENLRWFSADADVFSAARARSKPHASPDKAGWTFVDIAWHHKAEHHGAPVVRCDHTPNITGEAPHTSAASATATDGAWEVKGLRARGVRARRTRPDERVSGLVPPTVSVSANSITTGWAPLYIARPSLLVAPVVSSESGFGAALGYISTNRHDSSALPATVIITATPRGAVSAGAFGGVQVAAGSQRLSADMEWGSPALWDGFRHHHDAYTRTWQRSLAEVNASTTDFALTAGLLKESLGAQTHAFARAATEFPIRDNTTATIALTHTSALSAADTDATLSDRIEASTQRTLAITGTQTQWGATDRAWIRAGAGALLEYELGPQTSARDDILPMGSTSTAASSYGALIATAEAGLSLEGRFTKATHLLQPSIAALVTPTSYNKSPLSTEGMATRSGTSLIKLDQSLTVGALALHLPVSWIHTLSDQNGGEHRAALMTSASLSVTGSKSSRLLAGLDLCSGDLCGGARAARGRLGWQTQRTRGTLIASTGSSQLVPLAWLTTNNLTLNDAPLVPPHGGVDSRGSGLQLGAELVTTVADHDVRLLVLAHDDATELMPAGVIEYGYTLTRSGWRLGAVLGTSDVTVREFGLTLGWTN